MAHCAPRAFEVSSYSTGLTIFNLFEYRPTMLTVESILISIYGSERAAAEPHRVGRSAVSNWKAQGFFPSRVVPKLLADAREKNLQIDFADIPVGSTANSGAAA
jgi:hypothetical protein